MLNSIVLLELITSPLSALNISTRKDYAEKIVLIKIFFGNAFA